MTEPPDNAPSEHSESRSTSQEASSSIGRADQANAKRKSMSQDNASENFDGTFPSNEIQEIRAWFRVKRQHKIALYDAIPADLEMFGHLKNQRIRLCFQKDIANRLSQLLVGCELFKDDLSFFHHTLRVVISRRTNGRIPMPAPIATTRPLHVELQDRSQFIEALEAAGAQAGLDAYRHAIESDPDQHKAWGASWKAALNEALKSQWGDESDRAIFLDQYVTVKHKFKDVIAVRNIDLDCIKDAWDRFAKERNRPSIEDTANKFPAPTTALWDEDLLEFGGQKISHDDLTGSKNSLEQRINREKEAWLRHNTNLYDNLPSSSSSQYPGMNPNSWNSLPPRWPGMDPNIWNSLTPRYPGMDPPQWPGMDPNIWNSLTPRYPGMDPPRWPGMDPNIWNSLPPSSSSRYPGLNIALTTPSTTVDSQPESSSQTQVQSNRHMGITLDDPPNFFDRKVFRSCFRLKLEQAGYEDFLLFWDNHCHDETDIPDFDPERLIQGHKTKEILCFVCNIHARTSGSNANWNSDAAMAAHHEVSDFIGDFSTATVPR